MLPEHFSCEIHTTTNNADVVPPSCVSLNMVTVLSTHSLRELLPTMLTLEDHVLFFSMQNFNMSGKSCVGTKVRATLDTLEWLFACINSHVI